MDPVAHLLARDQHGIKFGLDNIATLCAALGHPERAWASVIVAGTNGKGSVTAMVASALAAAGHRTGRYTSPHLVRVEERFAIDDRIVTHDALAAAAAFVLEREQRCLADGSLHARLTFFEITTATAFELFRRERVRIVVLEVGMGGRFDATNAADPLAGAVTSIALDHTRFLGNTLGAIAFEKAGIARAGRPLVLGPLPDEAAEAIQRVAEERQVPLIPAAAGVISEASIGSDGVTTLRLRSPRRDYGSIRLGLRGRHQVQNAIVAVRLLECVEDAGIPVGGDAVMQGLSSVHWPARLQLRDAGPGRTVLLDAAHNPAGAVTLAQYMDDLRIGRCPIVFGAMQDKDVAGMLAVLAPHAASFVFTQARSARAMDAGDLLATAHRLGLDVPLSRAATPGEALARAFESHTFAVVAGSIFLIGDVLAVVDSGSGSADAPADGMLPGRQGS